ncbi:hypothetical protein TNCV_2336181 [Trichonephila clavipes]|uniref:Ubiquitin-like protease family profile domain-containing protein n=1 Tax=Trichonephila clavipes TaxID=2585209 RepID=A0A8X6VHX0_TRICX|nr:hypothetical protein TNCV_2336181 [Trichonephila clavipes]
MNVYDENDKEPNEGFKSRVKFIKGSGTVDMAPRDFLGVYPSDKIPKVKKKAALVVNTDPHDEEGSHWLAMYIQDEKTIEFLTLMDFHHRYTSLVSRNM